jgi:VCBS repeat-containing protein
VANTTLSENVLQGSAVDGNIEATDVDNDSLSYQVSTPASKGTVTVDEQGNYSYSPNQSELGADSFVVTVSDTSGEEVAVTVSVNINRLPALSIPENNEDEGGGGGSTSPIVLGMLLAFIVFRRSIPITN